MPGDDSRLLDRMRFDLLLPSSQRNSLAIANPQIRGGWSPDAADLPRRFTDGRQKPIVTKPKIASARAASVVRRTEPPDC